MDQKKPRPIYRSKGISKKTAQTINIEIIGVFGIAALYIFVPMFTSFHKLLILLGFVYLLFGFLEFIILRPMKYCRLYVFEDQLMGFCVSRVPVGPSSGIDPRINTTGGKFKLHLDEITNVEKGLAKYSQIVITAHEHKYTVSVKDPDKAYDLLCDMVFGPQNAKECVVCGTRIGTATEYCPHCGQMTRCGHSKTAAQAANSIDPVDILGIGLAIISGIIGLIIFATTIGDYDNIRTYGSLYISMYPEKAKRTIWGLLTGLALLVSCAVDIIAKLLIKKFIKK